MNIDVAMSRVREAAVHGVPARSLDVEAVSARYYEMEEAIARVRELCWECRLDGIELVLIPEIIAAIEGNLK
jgi:hypothetical protein